MPSPPSAPGCAALARPGMKPSIERPYFTAAIGVIMTVGALWGVLILLRIAWNGSFTSVGLHEVNAHGHAQIFGWVGLFVMGFGYRMLPLLIGRALPWKRLAVWSWLVLLVGVVLRSGTQPFVVESPWLLIPAHLGSLLEIAAIMAFALQIGWLLRNPGEHLPTGAVWLIRAALCFFVIQAICSAVYFHLTALAADRTMLLWLIAHFQPPLRDLQIHGFAMLMVLGVGMILLPRWFGARVLPRRGGMIAAAVLIAAVIGEITGFLAMQVIGRQWAALWGVAALMMLGAVGWIILWAGLLMPHGAASASSPFVRAAHAWLLVSLSMLVLLPVWQFVVLPWAAAGSHAVAIGFSHAYYGAIRHAITVGFVSLMILGMSSRLLESRVALAMPLSGALPVAFVLVNAGCALRVVGQAMTDIHPMAFGFASLSGILELTGIAAWASWTLRRLYGPRALRAWQVASGPAPLHQPTGVSS